MLARKRLARALLRRVECMREQREAHAAVAVAAQFPLYRAAGTTWRCTRCNTLAYAWDDGRLAGCDCPANAGAMPLEPTDPHAAMPFGTDHEREQLLAIEGAARHLLETMSLIGTDGKPLFTIANVHDEASAGLLRHAVINLQATLDGSPLPALALPKETH